jgi:hypothetical protein
MLMLQCERPLVQHAPADAGFGRQLRDRVAQAVPGQERAQPLIEIDRCRRRRDFRRADDDDRLAARRAGAALMLGQRT